MSKKKRSEKKSSDSYNNSPFKQLKGFAVSDQAENSEPIEDPVDVPSVEKERSFAEEMNFLGVDPLDLEAEPSPVELEALTPQPEDSEASVSDEDLFLASLGQLDVRFSDKLPDETPLATPRRLKQLKQGSLVPDASLDLHGLQRHQITEKIDHFLQNASYHKWQTLLIVTGRGLHSPEGEPVLRNESEKILSTNRAGLIAEWGRAPRQYGGEGALVVFLKKTTSE